MSFLTIRLSHRHNPCRFMQQRLCYGISDCSLDREAPPPVRITNDRLIDEEGGRVAGKPAAKVRERHGHGLGDDRLPGGPVCPAAHRPPGHYPRPGLIDKEPPVVRPRIERALGFDGRDHKAIQRARSGIVRLLVACGMAVGCGGAHSQRAPRGAVYRRHGFLPKAQHALLTQTVYKAPCGGLEEGIVRVLLHRPLSRLTPTGKPPPLAVRRAKALPFRRAQVERREALAAHNDLHTADGAHAHARVAVVSSHTARPGRRDDITQRQQAVCRAFRPFLRVTGPLGGPSSNYPLCG